MRILFVTSEIASMYKLGGLADVSRALPIVLSHLGIHVTIAIPYYEDITIENPRCLGTVAVDFDGERELVFMFTAELPDSTVPVLLFRHPRLNRYHAENIIETFAFFDKAVATLVGRSKSILGHDFDIVHCQDWHTSLVPLLIGENNKVTRQKATLVASSTKTILTIHNLLYQQEIGVDLIKKLSVPQGLFHIIDGKDGERINLMREGLEYADIVSTISPTYAKEITTPEYGMGLWEVLKRRGDRVVGILNGIETHSWNPDTDKALPFLYSSSSVLRVKPKIKAALQKKLGLSVRADAVLFGFVGRLETRQKGIDILLGAIDRIDTAVPLQVAFLGNGNGPIVEQMNQLVKDRPKSIVFVDAFDEDLARNIYAGSDVFLVPSKFEPCGLTQMIAMRYGTIPLVRKTGGLADSVEDGKTGFVFNSYSEKALIESIQKAINIYQTKPKEWQRMILRDMKQDFSWEKSAKKYKRLYQKLRQI